MKIHASLFASELILQLVVRSYYGLDSCGAESQRGKGPFAVGPSWG